MGPALVLPRLVFGVGALARLADELTLLGVSRPLLVSDRGLESAGLVNRVLEAAPQIVGQFLDIPENPVASGADLTVSAYREFACDGIVALGGGSVLDTAKLAAALVTTSLRAAELIGKPKLIRAVVPLVAIPTTVGTGSESSPVAALHVTANGPAIGTRGPLLVPAVALCDPSLARSLPSRLIAATGIDALSHCVEGFFAEPENPVIDALALDGVARVFADIHAALAPEGEDARASLLAAAFNGGAAIHKGLGPAHAVALACGDQHVHHGTLVAMALPHTTALLAQAFPAKADRLAGTIGVADGAAFVAELAALIQGLPLPRTLPETGYAIDNAEALIAQMAASPFNRTSPYAPTAAEYRAIAREIGVA